MQQYEEKTYKKKVFPPGTVPIFLPGLRSKYMQFEILSYLFEHIHQVSIFLRGLNQTSRAFLDKFKKELTLLYRPFTVKIRPPLKFKVTNDGLDGMMERKMFGFYAVNNLNDFEG